MQQRARPSLPLPPSPSQLLNQRRRTYRGCVEPARACICLATWLGSTVARISRPASSASSSTRPLLAHLAARRLFPRRSPRAPPWPSSRGGRSFVRSARSFGLGRARRLPSSAPRTTRSTHDLAAASGPRGAPVRASVAPQPAATAAQPHRRRPRNREASTRAVRGRHPNFLVRLRATLPGVTAMCSACACGPASAAVGAEQQGVDIDTFDGRRASA